MSFGYLPIQEEIENQRDLINTYTADGLFVRYKMMQKELKMTETLASGYSSESTPSELSNEYHQDRVWMVFKNLCALVLWTKVASAVEGLRTSFIGKVSMMKLTCRAHKERDRNKPLG